MKVVLRENVSDLGKRGDIVDVAKGFARNYLVPHGLAIPASAGIEDQANAMRKSRALRDAKDREAAEDVAKRLVATTIVIAAKAGEGDRLFGSVTAVEIAEAIESQTGVTVDKRTLLLEEPIKTLGAHQVTARLHSDVEFPVTVDVQRR